MTNTGRVSPPYGGTGGKPAVARSPGAILVGFASILHKQGENMLVSCLEASHPFISSSILMSNREFGDTMWLVWYPNKMTRFRSTLEAKAGRHSTIGRSLEIPNRCECLE